LKTFFVVSNLFLINELIKRAKIVIILALFITLIVQIRETLKVTYFFGKSTIKEGFGYYSK